MSLEKSELSQLMDENLPDADENQSDDESDDPMEGKSSSAIQIRKRGRPQKKKWRRFAHISTEEVKQHLTKAERKERNLRHSRL